MIDCQRGGAACFLLGIRKCGSTLLNQLCASLAQFNSCNLVQVAPGFFFANVLDTEWRYDPAVGVLFHGGNIYGGFRELPEVVAAHPVFRDGLKFLLVRDPRDALVSDYFSTAYAHPIPERRDGASPVTDVMEQARRRALGKSIDEFVVRAARSMRQAFLSYADVARSARTRVARYEDYIFRKPELVRHLARQFGLTVDDGQIDQMMSWADKRPVEEDPTAFVRRVTPGDHRIKLRPDTIAALNEILKPAMEAFGYSGDC
jgi:hypothetical protein